MAVTVNTITQRTAVVAGNLNGSVVTVVDDANGNTRKMTLAQLRTNLFAGGAGYTATDPLTAAAMTVTQAASSASVTINPTAGGASDASQIVFQRNSTGKWIVGSNVAVGSDTFSIAVAGVGSAMDFNLSTRAVTVLAGLAVSTGGIAVNGGTSTFQAISTAGNIDIASTFGITGSGGTLLKNNAGQLQLLDGSNLVKFGTMPSTNGQAGTLCITNSSAPAGNPTGGGFVYVEAGALKYRGSSGTVTIIAPA
jgi:hypothetical protein